MPTGHLPWMSTDTAGLTRPSPLSLLSSRTPVVATAALAFPHTLQPRNSLPHLSHLTATGFCLCLPSEMSSGTPRTFIISCPDAHWGLFPALPQPAALPCHCPFPEASVGTSQVLS